MPLICFASPKGGVGKTTLSANLADALQRSGRRVLAMDFDPQNTLRLHFGIPLTDMGGFTADLPRRPDWRACVRETASGVAVLPHGATELRGALGLAAALERDPELLAAPMRSILSDPNLIVIADTPPGPSHALAVLVPMASMVVAVLQAEAISAALIPDIDSGRFLGSGTMAALFAGRLRVVLNEVDLSSRLSRAAADAVARHLGPRLLGAVSRDETLAEALACQKLVQEIAPDSRAAEDIRGIGRAIEAALPGTSDGFPQMMSGWGAR
jgi:cellulose synthase operon protein YhjQ